MFIGSLVAHTIQLQRMCNCDHKWEPLNDTEDQCTLCGVIATTEGKKNLERMASSRNSMGRTTTCKQP